MDDALKTAARWAEQGERVALATLVGVRGSAPLRPGARLVVTASGKVSGSVSGGCVESDVIRLAGQVLESGRPALARYALTDESQERVGLGCGSVDVLIERFETGDGWLTLIGEPASGRPAALAVAVGDEALRGRRLAVRGDGRTSGSIDPGIDARVVAEAQTMLESGGTKTLSIERAGGDATVFVEAFARPPRLFLVGATDIATHLCPLAKAMGFDVTVIDPRTVFADAERFPDADRLLLEWPREAFDRVGLASSDFVVTLTHDVKFDLPALAGALRNRARYIGALGSVRTHARRIEALVEQGFAATDLERIHAPIGLDLGGRTPEEIALSIVAELVAVRYGRGGAAMTAKREAAKAREQS